MKKLLYLVHRIPYPPNKGDKITSFNMLKYLSEEYSIYLGCFVDDEDDWRHINEVKRYCADACFVGLNPTTAKLRALTAFVNGEALSLPYYRDRKLQHWVDKVMRSVRPDAILIFSGVMAQYVTGNTTAKVNSVLDLEDVDSNKWSLYADDRHGISKWVYKREAKKLLEFEASMARKFDVTVLVSKEEAEFFSDLVPDVSEKVIYRIQGVDNKYFDPKLTYENPYKDNAKVLVFTGAMDYWPNIDAVKWFGNEIFPKIRQSVPDASFFIVGMNPSEEVLELSEKEGITVTGGVPDVRPYLAYAMLSVAPLRVARGIQNKVLEAMAMEKPVLVTTNAMIGIESFPDFAPAITDTADDMAKRAISMLTKPVEDNSVGRRCIVEKYNWQKNLQTISGLLNNGLQVK